jgi:hypothetical protein
MIVQLWFRLLSWWSALLHCGLIDDDIETELQFHIDSNTPQLIEGDVAAERAGRRARIEFGRADVQKERYRSAIGLWPFDEIVGDQRYGLRSLFWGNKSVYDALTEL